MTPQDLPTEAYTVIRVHWEDSVDSIYMLDRGEWRTTEGAYMVRSHATKIVGFEVLAQPQGVLDAAAEAFEAKLEAVRALHRHRAHFDEEGNPWVSWEALNDALYPDETSDQADVRKDAEERAMDPGLS
jgi:hypothetical protein